MEYQSLKLLLAHSGWAFSALLTDGGGGGGGGENSPRSLKSVTHILQRWNVAVIPYLKKTQKIYESRDTPLSSADISIFSWEISKFCYIRKYKYRLHFSNS